MLEKSTNPTLARACVAVVEGARARCSNCCSTADLATCSREKRSLPSPTRVRHFMLLDTSSANTIRGLSLGHSGVLGALVHSLSLLWRGCPLSDWGRSTEGECSDCRRYVTDSVDGCWPDAHSISCSVEQNSHRHFYKNEYSK